LWLTDAIRKVHADSAEQVSYRARSEYRDPA
jgi:hypothetical protein